MRIRPLRSDDRDALHGILRDVNVFEPHEVRVAEELVEQRLAGSDDYMIYVAEDEADAERQADHCVARLVGFICFGHNPVTDAIHDIYWIVVGPNAQRRGIGQALLGYAEDRVRDMAGRGIRIETSSRPEYLAARGLYEACGYSRVAEIADFYKPGDGLRVYMKFV